MPKVRSGELEHQWRFGGTTLWVTEGRQNRFPTRIAEAEFPRAYTGPFRESVDILSYQARRADVADERLFLPTTVHMTTVGPWPHWLLMGRSPGQVLWTGDGEKYRIMADVPEAVRAACERHYPGFVADPFGLDPTRYSVAATMRRLRAAGRL